MPSTNLAPGNWLLTNLGPLTTTFTAPASCATVPSFIEIGHNVSVTDIPSSQFVGLGGICGTTPATYGDCLPSGKKIDSIFSTTSDLTAFVPTSTAVYFSPGLACPSGYDTVGLATKSAGGNISSSGPGFTYPYPLPTATARDLMDEEDLILILQNTPSNALLNAMAEGETAIICCPSNYTVNYLGGCYSELPSYPVPSSVCYKYASVTGGMAPTLTLSIYGTTFTGQGISDTQTLPLTPTTSTLSNPPAETGFEAGPFVAVSEVGFMYLVNQPTDTASSSATASSSSAGGSMGMRAAGGDFWNAVALFTLIMAFTSGFTLILT